jgi:hydrogenase maturation protease
MRVPQDAILGVGNILMGDDGLGVHAIRALGQHPLPRGIELIDGGTQGMALMHALADRRRLLVIDCIKAGGAPGTLYRLDWAELSAMTSEEPGRSALTLHQRGILDLLHLLHLVQPIPQTTFVGMEPYAVEVGTELSPVLLERVPLLLELCWQFIRASS